MPSLRVWESNDVSLSSVSYLLVACGAEGVLDRVWWVAALLAAEAPLGRGVARATGHPGSGLSRAGFCCTDQGLRLSMAGDPNHLRKDRWWFHICVHLFHTRKGRTPQVSQCLRHCGSCNISVWRVSWAASQLQMGEDGLLCTILVVLSVSVSRLVMD